MTKLLIIGQRAVFKCFDGRLVAGKVVAITGNCYLVIGDDSVCQTYGDGMYRFTDKMIVKG